MKKLRNIVPFVLATFVLALTFMPLMPIAEAQSSFSTAAQAELKKAITSGGRFGAPRYATASLPACNATNQGGIAWDTTTNSFKGCDGSSWASVGGATLAANTFTGVQTMPNGLANAPSLVFANSSTSGFWSRAANAIDLSANGLFAGEWSVVTLGISLPSTSQYGFGSDATAGTAADAFFKRKGAATIQMGKDANGAVIAQQFQGANGITGTDIAGGNFTAGGQVGTGAGAGSQSNINRALMGATGTSAQTAANAFTVCESKTLSNTTATTTALATIGLASNASGAAKITVSVQCTDGTNFDSDIVTSYVGYVNKAGAITVGTAVTTGTAAANNSGSCSVAPTFTSGASLINVNVTPVIGTIVPTTTTAFVNIENLGSGAVSCK